jgi:CheY-like chemotaxis protein
VRRIIAARSRFELLDALNGEAGLEIAVRQQPDLILLDINLPDLDGFEVLRRLKQDAATRDIPVIAVTANAMQRDIERGTAAGFADYLTKPLEVDNFLSVLERNLPDAIEDPS